MTVTLEKHGSIATLILNRPEKLNAMSDAMWGELHSHLADISADPSVRAAVIAGAGRAFSAGGDVTNMARFDHVSGRERSRHRHRTIAALYNLDKPVIAAVRGPVYGIANALALACDLVIASETANFSMAFKKVGVVPDGGTIYFLTQYLGIGRAKELVYTARPISATEACAMGLVVRVVPDDKLIPEATALALEIAQSASYALMLAKKMFQSMASPTLETLLETETLASTIVRLTDDHKEAVNAFKEKRTPKFTGR